MTWSFCTSKGRALSLLCVLLAAQVAHAERRRSTPQRLVDTVMAGLAPTLATLSQGNGALAVVFQYEPPAEAGPRDEVRAGVLALMLDRIGAVASWPALVSLEVGGRRSDQRRAARMAGASVLVSAWLFVRERHLQFVVEVSLPPLSFWSRVRRPVVGVRAHFYARARIDAELRALMDFRPESGKRRFGVAPAPKALQGLGRVLAVDTGDMDGDGTRDLALLTRGQLTLFRWEPGAPPALEVTAPLIELPRADRRPRDLRGGVSLGDLDGDGRAEAAVWTSALAFGRVYRRQGRRLDMWTAGAGHRRCGGRRPKGAPLLLCGPPVGFVPPTVGDSVPAFLVGEFAKGTNALRPRVSRLTATSVGALLPVSGAKWALSALALKKREPGAFQDLVAAVDGANVLHIAGGGERWRIREVGADLALVDLNDSGRAEVVYSSAALPGGPDVVSVRSLLSKGRTQRLWSRRWPGSVRVLGAGDMDNDGRSEVMLATASRLWVLRELGR